MKKSLKITLIVTAIVAVVVAAVALLISPVAKRYIEKRDHELLGRSIRMQELKINIFTGRLRLTDLRIGGAHDSTTFVKIDSFDMRLRLWPLLKQRVEVPYITFTGPDIKVYQNGSEFNFDGILQHFAADTTQAAEPSKPWEIAVSNIAIRRGHIFYKDLQLDATWKLNDIGLNIPGVYFSGAKTDVGVVLNFDNGGSLATQVGYDIESSDFEINLKLQQLTLSGILPYLRQSLNVASVEGLLWADVNLRGDANHLLSLRVDGQASMSRFRLQDLKNRTVAGIDSLGIQLAEADLGKMNFRLDKLFVGGFSTLFERTTTSDNFTELMKPSAPATADTASTPEPVLQIADIELTGGSVTYTDHTLHRPFVYTVSDIRMRSQHFDPKGKNNLVIDARMQKTGAAKLRWEGSVEDINNQNITLWLTNLALRDFAPFCEHYTAYPITTGNLSFRSQNVIRNRVLDGTNHLDMFEPKVDKKRKDLKPEMNIPLKLGLYVLKDKKGHVKMDLPVKGSLDSPEFSYRKIVLRAIGNVLLKVVTAPFSFLGGHNDNLEYINIEPRQYAFSSEQYASFDKIAQMLREKPEMHIALTQRLNLTQALPQQAASALKMAYTEHLYKAPEDPAATASQPTTANARLSMIEYEKIEQIDIRQPEVMLFADSLLALRGIASQGLSPTQKAITLYSDTAAAQLRRMMATRDQTLTDYMRSTHQLPASAFSLRQLDSAALHTYTGRNRYTLTLEVDGESVEITPSDSTSMTAPIATDSMAISTSALTQP